MYKRTITYTDYNGIERTEDFYFNMTEAELAEMNYSVDGGLSEMVRHIIAAKDVVAISKIFKEVLLKAYGQKSPDGRRFIKSEELSREFSQTEAYSIMYMELSMDDAKAAEFVNNIIPKKLRDQISKENSD